MRYGVLFAAVLALALNLSCGGCGGNDDSESATIADPDDDASDDDALPGDDADDDTGVSDDDVVDDDLDDDGDDDADDDLDDDTADDDADDDTGDDDDDDTVVPGPCPDAGLPLDKIELPDGFRICVFAQVPVARSLARGPQGTVFVGSREGVVHAVTDADQDGVGETVREILSGMNIPNGVAMRGPDLYVAEIHRVLKYPNVEDDLDDLPTPVVVNDTDFPTDVWHGWRFIAFGPDDKLYVPIGGPCNICDPGDPYASIVRIDPDGSNFEIVARGIRNSVGFDWHPTTHELWFTDNGRDQLGDDVPNDELNYAPTTGLHFGFPYCHEGTVADPTFGDEAHPCGNYTAPKLTLGPHVAALGMRFYTGTSFPSAYQGRIFIAQHGSWNRSIPIGYRVMTVKLTGTDVTSYDVFAEGWLNMDGSKWGRPVDVLPMADGSLLVSDDYADVIYRIEYLGT